MGEVDKKQLIIALATFISGYQELAAGYAVGGLGVPVSCAVGAAIGELLCDYVLYPKSESKNSEMSSVFNVGAHAFIFSWVASMLATNIAIPYAGIIVPAAGAFGATNFKNSWFMFG